MPDGIGHVSRERYEKIIAGDRELVAQTSGNQFTMGDHALQTEPMQHLGGSPPADSDEPGVYTSLQTYADDFGMAMNAIRVYRFTASRWPASQRRKGVSFEIQTAGTSPWS